MNLLTPIILILASIGLFAGYINPAYTAETGSADPNARSVKELQSEEKDYDDALNKTAEIERVRTGLQTQFKTIKQDDLKRIEKLLPDHIDSVRLIIDINDFAGEYGMSLSNLLVTASGVLPTAVSKASASAGATPPVQESAVSAGIGPNGRNYDSVKLGFTVTGSYDNFRRFLKRLEESLRVVDIVSLSFGSVRGGAAPTAGANQSSALSPDVYTYSMVIRTYYLK